QGPSFSAAPFRAAGSRSCLLQLLTAWNASLCRLLPAPLLDPRVVAGQKDIRDGHASILGRARELRPAGELVGETVLRQRAGVADHPRDEPGHRRARAPRGARAAGGS